MDLLDLIVCIDIVTEIVTHFLNLDCPDVLTPHFKNLVATVYLVRLTNLPPNQQKEIMEGFSYLACSLPALEVP
jgi:hypothetical protein